MYSDPKLKVLENRHLFQYVCQYLPFQDILSLSKARRGFHANLKYAYNWKELLRRDHTQFVLTEPLKKGSINSQHAAQHRESVPVDTNEQNLDYREHDTLYRKLRHIESPEVTDDCNESIWNKVREERLENALNAIIDHRAQYLEYQRLSRKTYNGVFVGHFGSNGNQELALYQVGYNLLGVKLQGFNVVSGKICCEAKFNSDLTRLAGRIQLADPGYQHPRWSIIIGERISKDALKLHIVYQYFPLYAGAQALYQCCNISVWRAGTKNPDKDNSVYLSIRFHDDGSDDYDFKEPDFHY